MESTTLADKPTLLIVSQDIKTSILSSVSAWWNNYDKNRFPGPQPISIEREHFSKLAENPYWVCAKTDGSRFLLVCVTCFDVNYCVLINRKNEIHLIEVCTTKDAFQGTILDGELIMNNETKQYDFLVYDATIVCGEDTTQMFHSQRISKARDLIWRMHVSERHNIHVRLKYFMPLNEFSQYKSTILPFTPYTNDGLIFTPEKNPVISGTNFDMFKWKPYRKNTVDFWVEIDYSHRNRLVMKLSKGKFMVCMHDHYIHISPSLKEELPGVVECEFNGRNNWVGLFMRADKTYPNSVFTMNKTLLNIRENIRMEEFENFI